MEILTTTKHVQWQECNSQTEGIDYEKTFASVAKHTSIQMGVKTTFSMEN
jgi:hypothetical protein